MLLNPTGAKAFQDWNLDRCGIHAAPNFGDIGPGERSSTVARLYLAHGGLEDFLARFATDREALAARQSSARVPDR